ncbi:transglutaminase family protein [Parasulfuritortus cantonensis]|uniref:transglutaminase family protein n=1 Tax=Parasulfuritortus cantonensis TaxID=2528202 RepID=UPI001404E546|nr:transglutaminase family protein [Parasulfuritortus cantonensis]
MDALVEWTTVTPDPAVIEVNTAPSVDARDFLARSRAIYATAADEGLAPYRLYYNGAVADSGGGGQITLGGPSPDASPFLLAPRLLPRLVRFLNRHPALSYLYCHDYMGSGGQSVRTDERGMDTFDELQLALALLERDPAPSPEHLWHGLASFLCDAAGNSHRAEVNIEKLWNPFLGSRGKQGLVEFRALRMQHSPERATALACLLRALVAFLACRDDALPLLDWGRELHDRFALPFYLEQDMEAVLGALASAGLELDEAITARLRLDEFRHLGNAELPGCVLEIRRALEFWPLLGDAASPEQGGSSRLVDASTARLEIRLRPRPGAGPDWQAWRIATCAVALPMRPERDREGELKVFGLRYRSFVPGWGLHPGLGSQTPVRLRLSHPDLAEAYLVTLHEWRPAGGGYPGLPDSLAEAANRRAERITVERQDGVDAVAAEADPHPGLNGFYLDLRTRDC